MGTIQQFGYNLHVRLRGPLKLSLQTLFYLMYFSILQVGTKVQFEYWIPFCNHIKLAKDACLYIHLLDDALTSQTLLT